MKLVTKKVVSLFAAIAMIASLFGAFAVTASADTVGYSLELDEKASTTTSAVLKVSINGVNDPLKNIQFTIPVSTYDFVDVDSITNDNIVIEPSIASKGSGAYNKRTGSITIGLQDANGFSLASSGLVATITLPIKEGALKEAKTVSLNTGEIHTTGTDLNYVIGQNDVVAPTATIPKDDSIKPDATTQPAAVEDNTPSAVTPTEGYILEIDKEATDPATQIVVKAYIKDIDGSLKNIQFTVPVSTYDFVDVDSITTANIVIEPSIASKGLGAYNKRTGSITVGLQDANGFNLDASGLVATITLPLKTALSDAKAVGFDTGEIHTTGTDVNYVIGTGDAKAPVVVVNPLDFVDMSDATTAPLSANMNAADDGTKAEDLAKKLEDETDDADKTAKGQAVFVTVDITDETGNTPAAYGTDYVAVYDLDGDGTDDVLTEAQYNNLIHGQTDVPVSDVIKGLKFKIFNSTNAAKISTTLQPATAAVGTTQLTSPVENEDISTGNTTPDTYVASNIALKDSGAKTATLGKEVTNTITVTPGSKNGEAYAYEAVTFKLTDESVSKLNLPGVQITYTPAVGVAAAEPATVTIASSTATELPVAVDGKYTVKFTAGSEGKVSYTVSYVGYDNKGVANTTPKTATVTYTVSATSTDNNNGGGGSSSGSSSGGGGAIATGYQGGSTAGLPGSASFTDLNDAPWAVDAVTMLAYQNIISGYEDNTFRPNGNITRAEYAQILINAIGHNGDSADTYFDDVPTDAWFYHNVAVASQLGIVSGYGDGNFGPYDLITREQMALMTQKAAQVMNVNLGAKTSASFSDDASIADWSRDAVYTLANAGIINGMDDGSYFAPQANATRAQAAVIIYNTFIK